MGQRPTRVAIGIVMCAVAAGCSSQEGIDILYVCPPNWYWRWPAATFVYLLIAPVLALRAADVRVIAALPVIGNTAVASFGVFTFLGILSETGYVSVGGNAIAAGLAEAIFPWSVGAAVSTVVSLVIASAGRFSHARGNRTRLGTIAMVIAFIAAIATAAFMWHLRPGAGNYREGLEPVAMMPFVLAAVALAAAVASTLWRQNRTTTIDSRRWL